jgi:hypothetical protein
LKIHLYKDLCLDKFWLQLFNFRYMVFLLFIKEIQVHGSYNRENLVQLVNYIVYMKLRNEVFKLY